MKTAVLLSGCGVYDGAEIHESVLTLLALTQNNLDFICTAPDVDQHHVVNHFNGNEMNETRNVFIESARISRGKICKLSELDTKMISSIIIVGGFGAAKNLSDWAFKGPQGQVVNEVRDIILHCIESKKPIVSLCISPTIIAKVLEGGAYNPLLTIGSTQEGSDYEIADLNEEISSLGAIPTNKSANEFCFDEKLKIISAPCYMIDIKINELYNNIKMAVDKLAELLRK